MKEIIYFSSNKCVCPEGKQVCDYCMLDKKVYSNISESNKNCICRKEKLKN